jgi:hypothetical protein
MLQYNTDVYFLPFVMFFFLKTILFEIFLIKDINLNYFKSKNSLIRLCIIIFVTVVGIIKFYNIFALLLILIFYIVFIFVLIINSLRKKYKVIDILLLVLMLALYGVGYGDIILSTVYNKIIETTKPFL